MYQLLIALSEKQREHLQKMKREHGLTYVSYIRWLLMRDIDHYEGRGSYIQTTTETIVSQRRRVTKRRQLEPQQLELQKELAPILAERRKKADQWSV
jgi:hypothetical protein